MRVLHKIYIYREKENLPEEGWFQSCFMCYSITSGLDLFKTIKKTKNIYEIYVYLCPCCQRQIPISLPYREKYRNKCNNYIRQHFSSYL